MNEKSNVCAPPYGPSICEQCGESILLAGSHRCSPTYAQLKEILDKTYTCIASLFKVLAPQCEVLPNLIGVLSQLDNWSTVRHCICGGEMELFESNLGAHEGMFCLVCKERFNEAYPGPHVESNHWFVEKVELIQALGKAE